MQKLDAYQFCKINCIYLTKTFFGSKKLANCKTSDFCLISAIVVGCSIIASNLTFAMIFDFVIKSVYSNVISIFHLLTLYILPL